MKVLVALLFVGVLCAPNEVDSVESLLADLKAQTQLELTAVNADYSVSQNLKANILFGFGKALQEQQWLCQQRDRNVQDRESDIDKTEKFIVYLHKRLAGNAERVRVLDENRCQHNTNYIERVKNDNITLRMIIFLRTSLQNLSQSKLANYGAFVEKFLKMYKTAKHAELITLATEFKDTMAVDWDNTPLPTGKDLTSYKEQLIEMLNDMERFIKEQIAKTQDLEINTGSYLADFKAALDLENNQLRYDVSFENQNLIKLNEQLLTSRQAAVNCKNRLAELSNSINITKQDIEDSTVQYNKQKARLTQELDLFTDVYRIYATQVGTTDDSFKNRVDQSVNQKELTKYQRNDYSLTDAVREQVSNE